MLLEIAVDQIQVHHDLFAVFRRTIMPYQQALPASLGFSKASSRWQCDSAEYLRAGALSGSGANTDDQLCIQWVAHPGSGRCQETTRRGWCRRKIPGRLNNRVEQTGVYAHVNAVALTRLTSFDHSYNAALINAG